MKPLAPIAVAASMFFAAACSTPETVSLFNGEDLSNWSFALADDSRPASEVFYAGDGMIHIAGEPFGYMYTNEKYSDYDLDLEWAWEGQGTNSGIFLMIEETTAPFPKCIECNLMAGNAGMFVVLGGASLQEYVLPEDGVLPKFPKVEKLQPSSEKPDGEWNCAHVEVRSGHMKVYINGVLQNEGTTPCTCGHIGLQSEGGPVLFRNVNLTVR